MKILSFEILYIIFNFHGISTPYPWYIEPLTHGILTTYPWYIDPPTHGISVFTTNFDRGEILEL